MIDLRGIISISGQGGLFKVVSQTKFGLIVESIADGKRVPAYSSQRISALEDISIFTTGDDMPLAEVFQKIFDKEKGGAAIDPKQSNDALRDYMLSILPEFDKERVYASDIKKLFTWYNLLQSKDLLKELKEGEAAAKEEAAPEASVTEEKAPKAKTTKKADKEAKEAAPKKSTKKADKENADEKPAAAKAKKTTSKKADK
jgi:hypothetical protein